MLHYTKNLVAHLQKQHHITKSSTEVEELMTINDELEINALAEIKIKIEIEWEANGDAEEMTRVAECNEGLSMTDVRYKHQVNLFLVRYLDSDLWIFF